MKTWIALMIAVVFLVAPGTSFGSSVTVSGRAKTSKWAQEYCKRSGKSLASVGDLIGTGMVKKVPATDGSVAVWTTTQVAVWQGGRWVVKSFEGATGTSEEIAEGGLPVACISDPVGDILNGLPRCPADKRQLADGRCAGSGDWQPEGEKDAR